MDSLPTTNNNSCKHAATLKRPLSQIKSVPSNETIGYSRRKTRRDSLIATVAIGYADGINRRLGNGGGINAGKREKRQYRQCVWTCVCLTSPIFQQKKGWSDRIRCRIQIKLRKLQTHLGTIPYEILAGVSQRVKRILLSGINSLQEARHFVEVLRTLPAFHIHSHKKSWSRALAEPARLERLMYSDRNSILQADRVVFTCRKNCCVLCTGKIRKPKNTLLLCNSHRWFKLHFVFQKSTGYNFFCEPCRLIKESGWSQVRFSLFKTNHRFRRLSFSE